MALDLVVTRTPLRLSFAGGGTDLEEFYRKDGGQVISTAINQFVYVTVKRHNKNLNPETFRLNYFDSEHVDSVDEIKNHIIREVLRFLDFDDPLYISTVADVPANSGLGSSSAFAVGLLNAIHLFKGEKVSVAQLAEEACEIEIGRLNNPIGKQDQYATAFGGLNRIVFREDGAVLMEPMRLTAKKVEEIFSNILIFSTKINRAASTVLYQQSQETKSGINFDRLRQIRDHCSQATDNFRNNFDPYVLGKILAETWAVKRTLSSQISNSDIDGWYDAARQAGAIGGKICGAGGGGYLMFIVPPGKQESVKAALPGLVEAPFKYEPLGTQLVVAR
ncbi:MAG: GHMP kinase [Sulfitobacter sp.]|nr:MAG: GHMP kinase [Sulfitobacter sp.]